MAITDFRFRAEGDLLVLQVFEITFSGFDYGYHHENKGAWRDANVEDLLKVSPLMTAVPTRPE